MAKARIDTYIRCGSGALQVWLDGTILLVEKSHVRYKVLDNVHVGERVDARFLGSVRGDTACNLVSVSVTTCAMIAHTKAGQCVDSVNVHGATSANSLATTPPEG